MSRCIDADTLEKILEKIPAADIKNMGGQAYVLVKLSQVFNVIDNQPTIEPRCEECEAFNKTRLLIPQPQRKKGRWIPQNLNKSDGMISTTVYYYPKCSVCGANANYTNFCPNCGADMREPEDIPMEYFESGGK